MSLSCTVRLLLTALARLQGRLLMLQARGGRLHLVAEKEVSGRCIYPQRLPGAPAPILAHVTTMVNGVDLVESLVKARRCISEMLSA